MGVNPQSNEVLTQNFIRAFTQRGGPGPSNLLRYAGADEQYLMMGDIAAPVRGAVNPINVNDPRKRGQFKRIGVTIEAPDIPTNTVTFKQRQGGVPWYTQRLDCPYNIYEVEGLCNDPADPKNGWSTMKIASLGLATERSYKGRTPFDGSAEANADIGFSWMGGIYDIGGLVLGEAAAVDVTTEVVDIVYGSNQQCADCGPVNDGTRWIYALQQTAGGSSAVVGKVLYSVDYGATWAASAITGLGVGALVTAIDIVGQYLIVLVAAENAYYLAPINQLTGVPGSWSKVTSGFVAAKLPRDLYVETPNRVYFVGDGGYIYVATDITAGVTVLSAAGTTTNNLARIHGEGGTIVAVGASGTVLKSTNAGKTWSLTTTQLSGTMSAVAVHDTYEFWAGNSAGVVSFTENGGESWTTESLPGTAIAAVHDIIWVTAEVGYIAATRTGPTATLIATWNGGVTWDEAPSSRLPAAPTYGRPNRIAYPLVPDATIASGNIAVAGLAGGLTDGVIYLASTPVY